MRASFAPLAAVYIAAFLLVLWCESVRAAEAPSFAHAILQRPDAKPLLLSRVSGGGSETAVTEFQIVDPQGLPATRKIPGELSWVDLTFERPLDDRTDLWDWREQVESGNIGDARQDIVVTLLDFQGVEIGKKRFVNAWPRSIQLGSTALKESAVITHEGEIPLGPNPQISISAPAQSAVFWNATALVVRATAQIPARVRRIDFFAGASLIGTASAPGGTEFAVTWTNPPPGIHALSAVATDPDGATFASENRVTVTLLSGLTFDQWRRTSGHFKLEDLTRPEISGPLADPDRDRVPNLFEYAWDNDPRRSDATALPRLERHSDSFVFVYRRRSGGFGASLDTYRYADVQYVVESSEDVVTWKPAGELLQSAEIVADRGGATETVSLKLSSLRTSRLFFRLRSELLARP